MTESDLDQVEKLASMLTTDQIADFLEVSRKPFYNIMDRQTEVLTHYKKGRAKAAVSVASGILQRARIGSTADAIFYAKTQMGWKNSSSHDDDQKFEFEINTV